MDDIFTITLITMAVALLRWSLLTDPDTTPSVRVDGVEKGFTTLVPVPARADSPHPALSTRIKR